LHVFVENDALGRASIGAYVDWNHLQQPYSIPTTRLEETGTSPRVDWRIR
jgi:hypothetical protein